MLDSQLAQLLLSDKIDQVTTAEKEDIYVKGFSHLSFHQDVKAQGQADPNSTTIIQAENDDKSQESINQHVRPTNTFKQSNKQFFSNVRQLREIKQGQGGVKGNETILEDDQDTLLDPRDRYNDDVEE